MQTAWCCGGRYCGRALLTVERMCSHTCTWDQCCCSLIANRCSAHVQPDNPQAPPAHNSLPCDTTAKLSIANKRPIYSESRRLPTSPLPIPRPPFSRHSKPYPLSRASPCPPKPLHPHPKTLSTSLLAPSTSPSPPPSPKTATRRVLHHRLPHPQTDLTASLRCKADSARRIAWRCCTRMRSWGMPWSLEAA